MLAGPRSSNDNWTQSYTVTDCTVSPCDASSLDRDPDPGEFLVKYLSPSNSTNQVSTSSRYRVQVSTAPAGYTAASTDWVTIPQGNNNNNTGAWNNGQGTNTHDFGEFTFNRTGFATIQVQVGGDRQGLTTVNGLAGVVLQLHNNGDDSPGSVLTQPWAKCTSDATGLCVFEVPITGTGGMGTGFRPWVTQVSAPEGWFMNTSLRTGGGDGGSSFATPYQFRLKSSLVANVTYRSTTTGTANGFMISSSSDRTDGSETRNASGGIWQQSRNNPTLPAQCGLDVALVLDFSGSVENAGQVGNLKAAATTITNSLVGTQSRAALFSFSTASPAAGTPAKQNYPSLTAVSTQAQANAFTNRWANWTATGGTNWDRALATVAQASESYNVVVVITDGNPTYYQNQQGPGSFNRLREMENAVFSANAVKNNGSRVIAVGVGSGATNAITGLNLAAISGQTKYNGSNPLLADYYQEATYAAAANAIRAMALGNCASSVSVTKMIVPNANTGENVNGAVTAPAGWEFTASAASPVAITDPIKATTGDGTGTVNFPIVLPSTQSSATVTLAESQQQGYQLVTQAGKRAVCTRQDTGAPVAVTNDASSQYGFSVDVPATTGVSCIVYNRAPDERASIALEKYWVINGAARVPDGQQNAEFQAVPLISGPSAATADPLTQTSWGIEHTGYTVGQRVTVGETYGNTDPLLQCELVSAAITKVNGDELQNPISLVNGQAQTGEISVGLNIVEITNEIRCTSELILRKRVDDRTNPIGGTQIEPDLWTLTAIAPDGALAGPSGKSSSLSLSLPESERDDPRAEVTPDVVYQLAESGGDPRYVQYDARTTPLENPQSTGTVTCERINPSTGQVVPGYADGIQGAVSVPMGYIVRCTANNETAALTLVKEVVGGNAIPSDWNLIADPSDPASGLAAVTVTGSAEGVTERVRPGMAYTLSESVGPDGYIAGSWSCTEPDANGEPVAFGGVAGSEVTLDATDNVTCKIVNTAQLGAVSWMKVDETEARSPLANSQWTLKGAGIADPNGATVTDCTSVPCGSGEFDDQDSAAGQFSIKGLAWGDYTLTETKAPAGYVRKPDPISFTVDGTHLSISLDPVANTPIPGPTIPLTGGLGRDFFLIAGLGVFMLGLGAAATARIKRRRKEVA